MLRRRPALPVLAEVPAHRSDGSRPGALRRTELAAYLRLAEVLDGTDVVLMTGPDRPAVALGLGAAMTVAGSRVALLECDLASPVLASALGASPAPGLHEYLLGEATPPEILQPLVAAGPASGGAGAPLTLIGAGGPMASPHAALASERCRHAIEMLRRAYDRLVISGPPLGDEPDGVAPLAALAGSTVLCGRRAEMPRRPAPVLTGFVSVG
jgi:tyrosine-protein kinase